MADIKQVFGADGAVTAGQVVQLINDGKVENLPLILPTLSVGTASALNGVSSSYISAVELSSTSILVVYASAALYAVVLTISGPSITPGTLTQISSVNLSATAVTAISSAAAVIVYESANTSNYLYAMVVNVSGSTITAGSPVSVNNASASAVSITTLTSTSAIVSYVTSATAGTWAVVLTISGLSITVGSITQVDGMSNNGYVFIAALSPTSVMCVYYYPYARVLTISGTTITVGAATQVGSGGQEVLSLAVLNSTTVFFAFEGTSNYLYGVVLTVSGTSISMGAKTQITTVVTPYISTVLVNQTLAVVSYQNASNNYIYAQEIAITNTTITVGMNVQVTNASNSTSTSYICSVLLTTNTILLIYQGATYYLYGVLLTPSGNCGKVLGVALDTLCTVLMKGVAGGFSGLNPGASYYFSTNGVISTSSSGTYLGVAISPTQILVPNYIID